MKKESVLNRAAAHFLELGASGDLAVEVLVEEALVLEVTGAQQGQLNLAVEHLELGASGDLSVEVLAEAELVLEVTGAQQCQLNLAVEHLE